MEGGIESIRRTERAREFFMQNTEDYKNKKGVCLSCITKRRWPRGVLFMH